MTGIIRRPNKRDLFVVGTAAALAFAPQAMAAEGTGGAPASKRCARKTPVCTISWPRCKRNWIG